MPPVHEIPAPGVNVINCTLAERGPPRDIGGSMFGSLGLPELLVIFAIILVVFGAGKLPQLGKGLGEGISNFRDGLRSRDEKKQIEEKKQIAEEKKNTPA